MRDLLLWWLCSCSCSCSLARAPSLVCIALGGLVSGVQLTS